MEACARQAVRISEAKGWEFEVRDLQEVPGVVLVQSSFHREATAAVLEAESGEVAEQVKAGGRWQESLEEGLAGEEEAATDFS